MKKIVLLLVFSTATAFCSENIYNKVPKQIMEKIIKTVEDEHPNDYSLQRYLIEKEAKNYLEVMEVKESLNKPNKVNL